MTIKEYFYNVGGNYEEAMTRFMAEERIRKFLLKLPNSTCFTDLCDAMEARDCAKAFSAVHSMKGVTGNMALTDIYELTNLLTEELRPGTFGANANSYFEELKSKYQKAIDLLSEI